jgi:FkbM family methyltransferase
MEYKKLFSKDVFENIAKSLHFRSGKYLERLDEKKRQEEECAWLSNFGSSDFFEYDLKDGLKVRLYKDSHLSKMIYKGFEKDETEFLCKVLRTSDYFIDIGANIGMFSLFASNLVGDKGKVFAFEPSLKTFQRLQENVAINNFSNIIPVNKGVSNKPGSLELYVSDLGYDAWNSFAPPNIDKNFGVITVPVTTLDNFLNDNAIDKSKITLIKIDVEGWEKFVLLGASNFLNNYSPTLMIEFTEMNTFNAGYFVHELYDYMVSLGYSWYRYSAGKLLQEQKRLYYPYDNLIATKNYQQLLSLLS